MTRGQGQEELSGGQSMSSKKRIAAVAITIAALTAGSASVASADDAAAAVELAEQLAETKVSS